MLKIKNLEPIIILTGPTGTGKSELAIELASTNKKIEIINADSLLIYRKMDIGTAKPSLLEQNQVPHHLIDICEPNEKFTAGDFFRAVHSLLKTIENKGNRALIVGGSGFYLKALLFGLWTTDEFSLKEDLNKEHFQNQSSETLYAALKKIDPEHAIKIGKKDHYRLMRALCVYHQTQKKPSELQNSLPKTPNPRFHLWILDRNTIELHQRIEKRTIKMLHSGFIEEVQNLEATFPNCRPLGAVGYAQVYQYLHQVSPNGRKIKPGIEGLQEEILLATRQLVKRQRTWFRSQFKSVVEKKWFYLDSDRLELKKKFFSLYA